MMVAVQNNILTTGWMRTKVNGKYVEKIIIEGKSFPIIDSNDDFSALGLHHSSPVDMNKTTYPEKTKDASPSPPVTMPTATQATPKTKKRIRHSNADTDKLVTHKSKKPRNRRSKPDDFHAMGLNRISSDIFTYASKHERLQPPSRNSTP